MGGVSIIDPTRFGSWGNYAKTDQSQYDRYNSLVDMWNKDHADDPYYGLSKKQSGYYHSGDTKWYPDFYGITTDSGNTAFDRYADSLLKGNRQSASDWLNSQIGSYADKFKEQANNTVNDYLSSYKDNMQNNINSAQQKAYEEAKKRLDAQKAYGYLSNTGYQNALQKLQGQTGMVNDAMYNAYSGTINNWEKNLNDIFTQKQNQLGAWDWSTGKTFDTTKSWLDASNNAKLYNQNAMNNDILNSVMDQANLYSPDEWIAYGAGTQGQYNPYVDYTAGTKKKKQTSTEGINEV